MLVVGTCCKASLKRGSCLSGELLPFLIRARWLLDAGRKSPDAVASMTAMVMIVVMVMGEMIAFSSSSSF